MIHTEPTPKEWAASMMFWAAQELSWMRKENGDRELMNETVRAILSRRSVREFTDRPISKALLDVILIFCIRFRGSCWIRTIRWGSL